MRSLITLAIVGMAVFMAVPLPVPAITMAEWAAEPITIGDKTFTLISSDWAPDKLVEVAIYGNAYELGFAGGSDIDLTNVTKTIEYNVTIIDDPATPEYDPGLYDFDQVQGASNWDGQPSGSFTWNGIFDDSSDFVDPFVTFSVNEGLWGPLTVPGMPREFWVREEVVVTGTVILNSLTRYFYQAIQPVPTESRTWGSIKALYEYE
jgi:hypothetical protein